MNFLLAQNNKQSSKGSDAIRKKSNFHKELHRPAYDNVSPAPCFRRRGSVPVFTNYERGNEEEQQDESIEKDKRYIYIFLKVGGSRLRLDTNADGKGSDRYLCYCTVPKPTSDPGAGTQNFGGCCPPSDFVPFARIYLFFLTFWNQAGSPRNKKERVELILPLRRKEQKCPAL